jgi:N-acetylglucosaminyldiphosphoundecaprenol N-acetyl-beta-D-mannosaminyltransferase
MKQQLSEKQYHGACFFDYQLFTDPMGALDLNERLIINTINPHSFCVARHDGIFKKALKTSDILLPDGIGIVLAQRLLYREKIKKISGTDIFLHILQWADDRPEPHVKKIFFLGSTEQTLKKIKTKIQVEYPSLQVECFSPPFKKQFSQDDIIAIQDRINQFKPHFLFVGMTAPKQEKWVLDNKEHLDAKVITSIGAVFDFYAENIKRPHPIWVKLGLEWFIRLLNEPRRLWRRTFISSPKFLYLVLRQKFKGNPS